MVGVLEVTLPSLVQAYITVAKVLIATWVIVTAALVVVLLFIKLKI